MMRHGNAVRKYVNGAREGGTVAFPWGGDGLRVRTALLRMDGTFDPGSLRVEGRVEPCTEDLFASALAAVVERSPGDVHVDMRDVDFIDLGGLRSLMTAACRLGLQNRNLILGSVAPHLVELMNLVGWEAIPGLTLLTEDPPPERVAFVRQGRQGRQGRPPFSRGRHVPDVHEGAA